MVGGVWALRHRAATPKGDGRLIAAPAGDYKVRPDSPGGMRVEGQGDSAFATSEGADQNGRIDLNSTAEAPVAGNRATPGKPGAAPAAKHAVTAAVPSSGGKLVAPPPARPAGDAHGAAASGTMVQLGAFNSEAQANAAWVSLSKRFGYLAPLSKSVATATVGGATYYRLRANAGGDAGTICGKLKVAGENCMVVN